MRMVQCCNGRQCGAGWAIVLVCLLSGCKSKQSADAPEPTAGMAAAATHETRDSQPVESAPGERPPSLPIGALRVEQEVLLYAALYRAAFRARVGDANHVILEPVSEEFPPNLGVEPAEFRKRVLEQVRDFGVPIDWAPSTWRTHLADTFPGSDEKATRLIARIISRDEDQATVTAEIGDRTADSRSSRQIVIATWDGQAWQIERGRARVVW
jgi:hypothetical protein